jgi:uncharacterized C2H2 Zn-finger protein
MFTYSSSDVLLGRIHGTLDSEPQRTVSNLVKPRQSRSLWRCPRCGALFVSCNLSHSCGRYTVKGFLRGKPKRGVELFRVFLKEYRKIGPIILHPVKTRVAFMVDIRFCGVNSIGADSIRGTFLLTKRLPSKKIHKIEHIPPRYYLHYFKVCSESDIDTGFRKYMKMAYAVGQRKHLS